MFPVREPHRVVQVCPDHGTDERPRPKQLLIVEEPGRTGQRLAGTPGNHLAVGVGIAETHVHVGGTIHDGRLFEGDVGEGVSTRAVDGALRYGRFSGDHDRGELIVPQFDTHQRPRHGPIREGSARPMKGDRPGGHFQARRDDEPGCPVAQPAFNRSGIQRELVVTFAPGRTGHLVGCRGEVVRLVLIRLRCDHLDLDIYLAGHRRSPTGMEDQRVHHPARKIGGRALEGPLGNTVQEDLRFEADTRGIVQSHIGHDPGKHQFTGKGKRDR